MRLRVLGTVFVLAGVFDAAVATAAPTNLTLSMDFEASCPKALDVQAELTRLLPGLSVRFDAEGANLASITDVGPSYRLVLGDLKRTVPDENRRCEERARTAAILIATTLDPPTVAAAPPPVEATPPLVQAAPPVMAPEVVTPEALCPPPALTPALTDGPPPKKRRLWIVAAAVAGALVVGAAVGLGVGLRPDRSPQPSLGRLVIF